MRTHVRVVAVKSTSYCHSTSTEDGVGCRISQWENGNDSGSTGGWSMSTNKDGQRWRNKTVTEVRLVKKVRQWSSTIFGFLHVIPWPSIREKFFSTGTRYGKRLKVPDLWLIPINVRRLDWSGFHLDPSPHGSKESPPRWRSTDVAWRLTFSPKVTSF